MAIKLKIESGKLYFKKYKNMNEIIFDFDQYNRLKDLYQKALENNEETVNFGDNILLVKYVKYLLEYLKLQFDDR